MIAVFKKTDAIMIFRLLTAVCMVSFCIAAQAVDIYRWVDEKGKVHFSDSLPEKYKHTARKSDSRQYELTEAQKKESAARAQTPATSSNSRKEDEAKTVSLGAPQTPGLSKDISTDCAALFKAYYDSQICFAPYKNRNGSMKPGAFENCKQVEDPTPQCGPVKTSPQSPY